VVGETATLFISCVISATELHVYYTHGALGSLPYTMGECLYCTFGCGRLWREPLRPTLPLQMLLKRSSPIRLSHVQNKVPLLRWRSDRTVSEHLTPPMRATVSRASHSRMPINCQVE
jgi:hypothetical protein